MSERVQAVSTKKRKLDKHGIQDVFVTYATKIDCIQENTLKSILWSRN